MATISYSDYNFGPLNTIRENLVTIAKCPKGYKLQVIFNEYGPNAFQISYGTQETLQGRLLQATARTLTTMTGASQADRNAVVGELEKMCTSLQKEAQSLKSMLATEPFLLNIRAIVSHCLAVNRELKAVQQPLADMKSLYSTTPDVVSRIDRVIVQMKGLADSVEKTELEKITQSRILELAKGLDQKGAAWATKWKEIISPTSS